MGTRGPIPSDPKVRQRKNRPEELRQLPTIAEAAEFDVPKLPRRPKDKKWAPAVAEWWKSAWRSPMRSMWIDVDTRGKLHDLLKLRQFAEECEDPSKYVALLNTIQKYEELLGFSPLARLRLRWEIPSAPPEPDPGRGHRRVEPETPAAGATVPGFADPRDVLGSTSNGGLP